MPRKHLRRITRQYRQNQHVWYLRPFSAVAKHPMYFALNRRSVTLALALGVFISMLPLPGHTPLAVIAALLARVNLAVAAVAALANTPLTLVPVFYAEYRLGSWLLNRPSQPWPESVSWEWLQTQLEQMWLPLCLGSLVIGSISALVAYFGANGLWHWVHARRVRHRRQRTRKTAV